MFTHAPVLFFQSCRSAPSEANWAMRHLKHVIGRLYAFEAQIHFQLAAMMRGMGEVSPEPFEARHLAVLRSGQGVQLFERYGRDGLVAEIEGVAKGLLCRTNLIKCQTSLYEGPSHYRANFP